MKTKIDYNSATNQSIKSQFVHRHVLTCFSYEMEEILKAELISYDDIENLYNDTCPFCGNTSLYYLGKVNPNDDVLECDCGKLIPKDELDSTPKEIYEWWIVSDFLYGKLRDKGKAVIEWGNNYYWGRCTTGQSIMLDSVISSICAEMEILEGQKYDWSTK